MVLHSAGRHTEAILELEAFLRARPSAGPAHLLVDLSHLRLGHYCQAIGPLKNARRWHVRRSLVELADAHQGCGEHDRAARAYEAAMLWVQQNKACLARRATHEYWLARLYPEAKRLLRSVATEFAEDPEFSFKYGDTLVRTKGPEQGVSFLLKSANAAPTDTPLEPESAKPSWSLAKRKKRFRTWKQVGQADASVVFPLSRAYKAVGRIEDAKQTEAEYRSKLGRVLN